MRANFGQRCAGRRGTSRFVAVAFAVAAISVFAAAAARTSDAHTSHASARADEPTFPAASLAAAKKAASQIVHGKQVGGNVDL